MVPVAGNAQTILLTAGDFVALGGTAVTGSGAVGTVLSGGDVGSQAAVTGFPPALVAGGSVIGTGARVDAAMLDFGSVRTDLAALVLPGSATVNLSGTDLGGLTLGPGVYAFDVAAAIGGSLQLDAQGLNNAVWVFQIGSALGTSAGATVSLINPGSNGGSDAGIFWVTGTAMTFGANNAILGNYLAGSSITLGALTGGSGRMLAGTGITFDTNLIDAFGGPSGSDWTGGLGYDGNGDLAAVPEPSAAAALAGLGMLAVAAVRRRRSR